MSSCVQLLYGHWRFVPGSSCVFTEWALNLPFPSPLVSTQLWVTNIVSLLDSISKYPKVVVYRPKLSQQNSLQTWKIECICASSWRRHCLYCQLQLCWLPASALTEHGRANALISKTDSLITLMLRVWDQAWILLRTVRINSPSFSYSLVVCWPSLLGFDYQKHHPCLCLSVHRYFPVCVSVSVPLFIRIHTLLNYWIRGISYSGMNSF